jgi:hypothetical protein
MHVNMLCVTIGQINLVRISHNLQVFEFPQLFNTKI